MDIRSILSCHISAILNKKLLASDFFIILLCEYIFLFSQRLFNFIGNISTSKPKPILVCPAQQFRKNHCRNLPVYVLHNTKMLHQLRTFGLVVCMSSSFDDLHMFHAPKFPLFSFPRIKNVVLTIKIFLKN